jgi:microtubule-associated protein-like 6
VKGAGFKQYRGHSGEIASIGFNATGSYCFSLGKKDRCVFQWRKTNAILSTEQEKEQIQSGSGSGDAATTTSTMTDQQRQEEEQDTDLHVEGLFIPETFINVPTSEIKPYISHLSAPSDEKKNKEPSELDGDANKIQFELEHVFGYRTFDVRNTVVYSKNKKILYATGCLGVQYDRRMHQQQFYMGHTRPIVSLASSNDGSLIATGEMVTENVFLERPRIHIWEPSSCSLIQILSEFHQKAISYLAFSPNRKMLASIGQDQYHSLCIYHSSSGLWFDGAMLGYSRTSRQKVFFVNWIEDPAASFHLVTGGHMHVLFWKMDGPHLIGIQGVFGEKASIQPMLCGQSMGTNVILGTNSGHLYVWESAHLSKAIPAHSSAVFCLHATSNGCVSGSKDGHIKVWSRKMIPLSDFDMNDVKPAVQNPSVRSICWDIAEDRLLVGTKGGEILEISRLTNETSLVTESHFENELFGLSLHPIKNDLVATAGEDRTVRIWNLTTRQVDAKVFLDAPLHSITYSYDGKLIAVGFGGTNQVAGLRKDGTVSLPFILLNFYLL